ncbi:MAG: FtsQ-type POTRA domain-containing protein [Anaerovoracaceae bacterium]|jgi:cell division protein FtsQ
MDERRDKKEEQRKTAPVTPPDTRSFEEKYGREMAESLQAMHRREERDGTDAEAENAGTGGAACDSAEETAGGQTAGDAMPAENGASGSGTGAESPGVRRRPHKKRRKKHGFLWFCIICALLAGGLVFLNSSYFSVEKITVRGCETCSADWVVKKSGVRTGAHGSNLFRVRGSRVKARLTENPYIQDVSLQRKPPHELVIRLVERKETAYLPYGSKYIVINQNGVVLRVTAKEPELTRLDGITIKTLKEGEKLGTAETDRLHKALGVLRAMRKSEIFFKRLTVSKVYMNAYIYDDLVCRGTPANLKRTLRDGSLPDIVYDLYKKKIKKGTINIGSGNYISYSPKVAQ